MESMFFQECGQKCMKNDSSKQFEEIGAEYEDLAGKMFDCHIKTTVLQ